MRAAVVVWLGLISSQAHADPKPAPKATKDDLACKNLIDDARNFAAKSKLKEAMAKLEACIALVPDHVTALGELGFTAYRAKDLKKAEQMTRKALAGQGAPDLRGAVFYNLGLILEENKDRVGAIAAYSDSLRSRPNGVVRGKLRALDAKAAEAFDPYRPVGLAGPFPTIAAYCKTLPRKVPSIYRLPPGPEPAMPDMDCTCGSRVKAGTAGGPYKQVEAFERTCGTDLGTTGAFGNREYSVGVETSGGWYVTPVASFMFTRKCSDSLQWPVLGAKDLVAGGDPEVAIEFTTDGECMKGSFWSDRSLVVVGIGPSKAPSATPPIRFKHKEEVFVTAPDGTLWGATELVSDIQLKLTWTKDGLDVTGKTTGLDKASADDILGTHKLPFP